jgi:gamma-glutamylputrescine oxidase
MPPAQETQPEQTPAVAYWLEEERRPLVVRRVEDPDVAVIGGGVTGCACALALAHAGLDVRLYEAREIASGASGRNAGFALRGGAMPYHEARELFGRERARDLWRFTERGLRRLESLAGDAFRRTGSLRLAADPVERGLLAAEYAALREDGFAADWLDELDFPLSERFHGAIVHPGDGSLQPARWAWRLAALAAEAGVELREWQRVESLEGLDAEDVVIATDGYTQGLLPALDDVVRPTRGQILVTEPLPDMLFPRPHYARYGYDYWLQLRDRRLLIGGKRDMCIEDEYTTEEATTAPVQTQIEALVRELLGRLPKVTHRWSGIFGTTEDALPLVGSVPGRGGLWVACGYSGPGNVLGLACGELVAEAILGRRRPVLEVFDPARLFLRLEARHVG